MTFPLDITKTRLQTQGEIAAQLAEKGKVPKMPYRGMFRTAIGISKDIYIITIVLIRSDFEDFSKWVW